jgi:hypothetical protein
MVEEDSALGAGVGSSTTGCTELSEGLEEDVGLGEGDGLCAGAGARFNEAFDEEFDKEEEVDGVVDVVEFGVGVWSDAPDACGSAVGTGCNVPEALETDTTVAPSTTVDATIG